MHNTETIKSIVFDVIEKFVLRKDINLSDKIIDDLKICGDDDFVMILEIMERTNIKVPNYRWEFVKTVSDIIVALEEYKN